MPLLIAEDVFVIDEAEHVYEALQLFCRSSSSGKKAIVGVCSFMPKSDSLYIGHFQPTSQHVSATRSDSSKTVEASSSHQPLLSQCEHGHLRKDRYTQATKIYESVMGPPKSRHGRP
jgi:hypothetical protein